MTSAAVFAQAPDLTTDSYLVVGVATCYVRDDGDIQAVTVIEPVPSAYLEAVLKGVPTSYQHLYGTTLGAIAPEGQPTPLTDMPAEAQFCQDFIDRAIATARTYQNHPEAQSNVPVGSRYDDINYSTEKKRVLNMENVVTAADNVKQHDHTHKVL